MKLRPASKLFASSVFAFIVGCTSSGGRHVASDDRVYRNELRPFSSDGCSSFPDGIPYLNENKWLKCCVIHDVAYWQGGTAEQKLEADRGLRSCVAATGERAIAEAMYLGVRVGGYERLPFTWRWGYGWTINRGYRALSDEEKSQVETLLARVPKNLEAVAIVSPGMIPTRATLTGDYCLDAAVEQIEITLGHGFRIVDKTESTKERADGFIKSYSILTDGCPKPFTFSFLQTLKNACMTPANEMLVRGRVRLQAIGTPPECVRATP